MFILIFRYVCVFDITRVRYSLMPLTLSPGFIELRLMATL